MLRGCPYLIWVRTEPNCCNQIFVYEDFQHGPIDYYHYPKNSQGENKLARSNYQFKKRQKELARKKKKELKRQRKQNKNNPELENDSNPAENDELAT